MVLVNTYSVLKSKEPQAHESICERLSLANFDTPKAPLAVVIKTTKTITALRWIQDGRRQLH